MLERKCEVRFVVSGRILVLVFHRLMKSLVNNLANLLLRRKNVKIVWLKKEKQHFLLQDSILKKTHLRKSSIIIHMVINVS